MTGTSRGIGHGVAAKIAEAGANVLAISRSGKAPRNGPGRIVQLEFDLRSESAPEQALEVAVGEFGRVDGLVNNAGIIRFSKCWEHSDEDWDDLFETNLTAPFRLSQRIARHWIENSQGGAIVNMCSIESRCDRP